MSTPSIRASTKRSGALFGTAASGCLAYAALALLLMHVLRSDPAPTNHMMSEHHIRHLPVVEEGKAIGMLSLRDLFLDLIRTLPLETDRMRGQENGPS